jgi:NAD(P)-dependent dehydrogenase (short-subunit alcohol dehydrogenase family)
MGRRFEGKTVFVTGAGSGIGRAACLAFAEEGARVAAADLNNSAYLTAKQILGKGGKAVGLQCDVCDSAAVDNAIKQCEAELGPIDVAFNCAGVEQPHASLADISDSVAEKVVGVNIMGLFHSMRSVSTIAIYRTSSRDSIANQEIQAMMRRSAPGVILNVASGASVLGITGQAVYVASKFAVDGLTKSAALDHIKDGIRINSISPGIIWTEQVSASPLGSTEHG